MKRIAIFLAIAIAAVSCVQEETVTPEIKVTTPAEELVLSSDEGILPVAFNVNVDWTAEIKEPEAREWCTVSPAKGGKPGDNVLNVICIANAGTENRTATLVIKALDAVHEMVLTQLQKDVLVITADKEYDIPYQGKNLVFKVAHNLDLKVRPDVDWITEVKSKTYVEDTLMFAVAPNAGEAREGKITFTADPFEEEIVIKQAPWVLEFTVDPAEDKAFDADGGEHKITVASNVEYTVKLEEADWLKMSVDNNEYVFTAEPNSDLKARQTTFRVAPKSAKHIQAAKTIVISQKGKGAKLTPSVSELRLTCLEQTFDLSVDANIEYEMTFKKSVDGVYVDVDPAENWLAHTVSGDVYTFSASANDSWEERSMILLFTPVDAAYSDMVTAVPVYQYGHAFKMWSKRLTTIEGYDPAQKVRLALYGDKLLLANTTKVYMVDPATGEVVNTIQMPDGVMAHSLLVDDAGNLMIAADAAGMDDDKQAIAEDTYLYYVADPANPTLDQILTYNTGSFYCVDTGNFRVKGNIKENAIITATVSAGAGGAVLVWEIVNGACGEGFRTNVPYDAESVANACAAPLGTSLADGIFYIGYGGDKTLMYADKFVKNPAKDEDGNFVESTAWTVSYETGTTWEDNYNCISITEWKGNRYAAIVKGNHFDYFNSNMLLLDINDPAAATLVYEYDGEFDVERGDSPDKVGEGTWDNLWWTGAGKHSDIVLIPADDALLMIGADSNYGTITCVTIM